MTDDTPPNILNSAERLRNLFFGTKGYWTTLTDPPKYREDGKHLSEKLVDIDTSGPEKEVAVEEVKEEAVVETKEETPRIAEVEKEEPKKEDDAK